MPVVLQTAGAPVTSLVTIDGPEARFRLTTPEAPVALFVDPAFDVFRRLDPRETPPSIGQIFGEPRVLAILPAEASPAEAAAYRAVIEGWKSPSHATEIRTDGDVSALPAD